MLSLDSWQVKSVVAAPQEPNFLFSKTLEDAVAVDLSTLREVEHVLVERAEGNLLVWISVDDPTKDIRERVFRKQYGLIEGFPEISFDFNIVIAKNRSPREFASDAKLVYSRKG